MENQELTHHGILGMKWGVRRYQNKDGSLTKAGKKRYGDDEETVDKEAYETAKQKAIKSGSAADVLKYQGDLTQQEMQSAINRIRWEQDMAGLAKKDAEAGQRKVDDMLGKINKGIEIATTGAKAYNMVANVVNAFNGGGKLMPKIDVNITNGNRKERLSEEKDRKKAEKAAEKRQEQEAQRETKRAERAAKRERENESGTTKGQSNDTKAIPWTSESKVYDAEWRDIVDSNVSVTSMTRSTRETAEYGKSYVMKYLNPPREDD